MKTSGVVFAIVLAAVFAAVQADTFTHRSSRAVYHGFATQTVSEGGRTLVHTLEQGPIALNLAEFDVVYDPKGRQQSVAVIPIKEAIEFEIQTSAFEQAIINESNKGHLYILIEIDSPGGRIDLAQRMCAAIINTRNCPTVAFISGQSVGGAYSAAAAVALVCNAIYMVPTSSIGAATAVLNVEGYALDLKEALGETVGEKISSVWRNYLAALAQQNNRPSLLAKAMEDRSIEVLEVRRQDRTFFLESHEMLTGDQVVRIRCKKDELLTLPAADAAACGIADGVVESREALRQRLGCPTAEVVVNPALEEAAAELDKVIKRFDSLNQALDSKYKEMSAKIASSTLNKNQAVKDLQFLIKNAEYLSRLKKAYPDVPVSEEVMDEFISALKADYQAIRR